MTPACKCLRQVDASPAVSTVSADKAVQNGMIRGLSKDLVAGTYMQFDGLSNNDGLSNSDVDLQFWG